VVASSEWLASGGDHLCTDGSGHLCIDDSPAATTASAPSGSPAEATTSATGSLTSGGDHLYARQPPQWWRPPQHVRQGEEVLASVPLRGRGQDHPSLGAGSMAEGGACGLVATA
jgi:hypothetical protein